VVNQPDGSQFPEPPKHNNRSTTVLELVYRRRQPWGAEGWSLTLLTVATFLVVDDTLQHRDVHFDLR
jgi:hypothetical protein